MRVAAEGMLAGDEDDEPETAVANAVEEPS